MRGETTKAMPVSIVLGAKRRVMKQSGDLRGPDRTRALRGSAIGLPPRRRPLAGLSVGFYACASVWPTSRRGRIYDHEYLGPDRPAAQSEMPRRTQKMPVVGPHFRQPRVSSGDKVDRIAGPQVDARRQIADCGLDVSQDGLGDRVEQPHAVLDVFHEGAAEFESLAAGEPFLADVTMKDARHLRQAQGRRLEIIISANERPYALGIRLVDIALRHVRRVEIQAQERSCSRKRPLSPCTCGKRASHASRSGSPRAEDLPLNGRISATGVPRFVITIVRPAATSSTIADVSRWRSRTVFCFMCHSMTLASSARQQRPQPLLRGLSRNKRCTLLLAPRPAG